MYFLIWLLSSIFAVDASVIGCCGGVVEPRRRPMFEGVVEN